MWVEIPNCKRGRSNLDFGQGFYVTDIFNLAINFARSRSIDRKRPPIVNVYFLDQEQLLREAKYLFFNKYDAGWLDFVVACRSGRNVWAGYDYVEGGVADDRVINTISLYMRGIYSKEEALHRLRFLKPNNQICILNQ